MGQHRVTRIVLLSTLHSDAPFEPPRHPSLSCQSIKCRKYETKSGEISRDCARTYRALNRPLRGPFQTCASWFNGPHEPLHRLCASGSPPEDHCRLLSLHRPHTKMTGPIMQIHERQGDKGVTYWQCGRCHKQYDRAQVSAQPPVYPFSRRESLSRSVSQGLHQSRLRRMLFPSASELSGR